MDLDFHPACDTFCQYFPNHPKRDYIRKLEAALYTLRLPDELDLEKFSYDLDEIIITPDN